MLPAYPTSCFKTEHLCKIGAFIFNQLALIGLLLLLFLPPAVPWLLPKKASRNEQSSGVCVSGSSKVLCFWVWYCPWCCMYTYCMMCSCSQEQPFLYPLFSNGHPKASNPSTVTDFPSRKLEGNKGFVPLGTTSYYATSLIAAVDSWKLRRHCKGWKLQLLDTFSVHIPLLQETFFFFFDWSQNSQGSHSQTVPRSLPWSV